ncbi:MAG: DUF1097 domain-containing protein [Peptostreptococcaceae bacterium]|nr:DUF1097 domain-containing protein [Peptostreptococcaceae bacterium]
MKPRIRVEFVVGFLTIIACLVMYITNQGVGIPLWAIFIGWAEYFALGAKPELFKTALPSLFPGAILASVCLWGMSLSAFASWGMWNAVFWITLTVFLLMVTLNIPQCNIGLVGFNSFTAVFIIATIGPTAYPTWGCGAIISGSIWVVMSIIIGYVFGYLSILLQFPKKVD